MVLLEFTDFVSFVLSLYWNVKRPFPRRSIDWKSDLSRCFATRLGIAAARAVLSGVNLRREYLQAKAAQAAELAFSNFSNVQSIQSMQSQAMQTALNQLKQNRLIKFSTPWVLLPIGSLIVEYALYGLVEENQWKYEWMPKLLMVLHVVSILFYWYNVRS